MYYNLSVICLSSFQEYRSNHNLIHFLCSSVDANIYDNSVWYHYNSDDVNIGHNTSDVCDKAAERAHVLPSENSEYGCLNSSNFCIGYPNFHNYLENDKSGLPFMLNNIKDWSNV